MILAGDVGGTKARLALYHLDDGILVRDQVETFVSRDFTGLDEIIRKFLEKHNARVTKACIGVPGPVVNGSSRITNLPWEISEKQIVGTVQTADVKLVNDLVATAAAIPYFDSKDLFPLHEGKSDGAQKVFGVLAPGTGLGQAFLIKESGKYHAFASEGGHTDFAPSNAIEAELLGYLKTKFPRVSYERILSGPGLLNIYSFLKEQGHEREPEELRQQLEVGTPAEIISTAGQDRTFDICVKTLDIFSSVLGSQAGNLVLTLMATGGIYLGGGIPPKICKKLADGVTADAYLNKGRLSDIVKNTPLYIIRDDHAALMGAASIASRN